MSPIGTSVFDLHREQVEGMLSEGECFGHVEDAIDGAGLSPEHRDALWLFAWAWRARRRPHALLERAWVRPADRLVPVRGEA